MIKVQAFLELKLVYQEKFLRNIPRTLSASEDFNSYDVLRHS